MGCFFFSLLGCGIHGTAGTVTLTRYDTILMMLTCSGPSGTIAIRCRQFIIVSQAQSRCAVCCHVTVSLLLQVMTPGLYYYYSTELAFYWSLVFSQFTDIKRKVRGTGVVSALRQQLERLWSFWLWFCGGFVRASAVMWSNGANTIRIPRLLPDSLTAIREAGQGEKRLRSAAEDLRVSVRYLLHTSLTLSACRWRLPWLACQTHMPP